MPAHVAYIPPGRGAPKRARGERMREVQAIMGEHAAEVARLEQSTLQSLLPVLLEARRELKAGLASWLGKVRDGKERFTAQQLRNALLAVETTLRTMAEREPDVLAALTRAGVRAGELGTRHLVQEVARFSEVFEGTPHRVQIDTAAVIARGDRLLIPRFRTSAARYVGAVREDIRQQFAVGLASGETFDQLTRRLVRHGGPRGLVALRGVVGEPGAHVEEIAEGLFRRYRHWAERLTRTEVVHAYNVQHQQALEELDATRTAGEPAYCRRWDASTDRRVCPICASLDRRAVGIEEPFPGGIAQPPAHPMCRCTVSAWHPSWGGIKGEVPPIADAKPPARPRPAPQAASRPKPARSPIPSYKTLQKSQTGQIARQLSAADVRALVPRVLDIEGKPIAATSEQRLDSLRGVFRQGQAAVDGLGRGVQIAVRSDGAMEIIDGRHRLLVAREFPNIKLKITFVEGI